MISPILIGALCALCIIQALVTVAMIPFSIDEVLATLQYLRRAKQAGEPFWRTFWLGGPSLTEDQTPAKDLDRPFGVVLKDFLVGGMSYPWTLVATVLLGMVLMTTPFLVSVGEPLYFSNHIAGCLAIMIAVTAMAEVVRPVRWLNAIVGGWVAASPFVMEGGSSAAMALDLAVGLALVALSLPRGRRSGEHYGGWDRAII